jgi:hypothetical protein
LPAAGVVRRWSQSLAVLDAIMSGASEYRYFSFDREFGPGQALASMRNGSGDEYSITFPTTAPSCAVRAGRRGLQMVLRLLAHNAEHWLATHLNAYLRDDDEYRAITRQTIIRGLAGVISFIPATITVTLAPPGQPRVALARLTDEINAQPPSIPGGSRPLTYHIATRPGL